VGAPPAPSSPWYHIVPFALDILGLCHWRHLEGRHTSELRRQQSHLLVWRDVHDSLDPAEIHVEVCSACHPFYTGKQKLVDTAAAWRGSTRSTARREEQVAYDGAPLCRDLKVTLLQYTPSPERAVRLRPLCYARQRRRTQDRHERRRCEPSVRGLVKSGHMSALETPASRCVTHIQGLFASARAAQGRLYSQQSQRTCASARRARS